jgi:hypothetical protein
MLFAIKHGLSMGLIIGGAGQYLFPEFTGVLGSPIKTSIEHRELIGTLAFLGGLILLYMPTDLKE